MLVEVVKGGGPAGHMIAGRRMITVAELCRQYLAEVKGGRLRSGGNRCAELS